MSRIGRKTIQVPANVVVSITENTVLVKGPNGELTVYIHPKIKIAEKDNEIEVTRRGDDALARSLHGLTRTLIANAIEGVSNGFEKNLEIIGVGYRASVEDEKLILKVGFSHEVIVSPKEGIKFEVKKNIISVKGFDKQLVGQTAAEIRSIKKPEPYKGKGIKYVGERIIRKVGKAVKGSGA